MLYVHNVFLLVEDPEHASVWTKVQVYSLAGFNHFLIFANRGVYAYSGQAITIRGSQNRLLIAAPGNYDYDGSFSNADVAVGSGAGAYLYQGQGASFPAPLLVSSGVYTYQGFSANLVKAFGGHTYFLPVTAGVYRYSGGQATLRMLHPLHQGLILTTSTRTVLGPKRVNHTVAVPFDFSTQTVAGDVLSAPVVNITVWSGVDPNPGLVFGGTIINGPIVYLTLTGGIAGVIYQVDMQVSASVTGSLVRDAFLSVLPAGL